MIPAINPCADLTWRITLVQSSLMSPSALSSTQLSLCIWTPNFRPRLFFVSTSELLSKPTTLMVKSALMLLLQCGISQSIVVCSRTFAQLWCVADDGVRAGSRASPNPALLLLPQWRMSPSMLWQTSSCLNALAATHFDSSMSWSYFWVCTWLVIVNTVQSM